MDANIKAFWVSALRSEDYQQTTGRLHARNTDGDQFCCLGVLCDLAVQAGVEVRVDAAGPVVRYGKEQSEGVLPREVVQWAGLNENNPAPNNDNSLATLNDSGVKFPEIADYIEAGL